MGECLITRRGGETYKIPILDANYPENVTAKVIKGETTSATFIAVIAEPGNPAIYTYQWYVDGVAVEGATSSSYTVAELAEVGTHTIYCEVTNKKGTVTTRIATLEVTQNYLPTLDEAYPKDATVDKRSNITSEVVITEDGNPAEYTYQWYKNGTAVEGATEASYTFTAEKVGTVELYCKVSSSVGTVTSRTATITAKNELVLIPGASFSSATKVNQNVVITRNSDDTYTVRVPINGGAGISVDVTEYKTMEIYASYNTASGTDPKIGLFSAINPSNFITGYDGGSAAATVNTRYDISSVTGSKYFGLYNTTAGDENETKVFQLYRVVFKE